MMKQLLKFQTAFVGRIINRNMKITNIFLITGLIIRGAFGLWHFFIPYQYNWYSYIPSAPREIIVSVDWINFFFSLFLSGNSVLLFIFRKKILAKEIVSFSFYGFLTFAWLIRVIITMVHPWNYDLMQLIQLDCFVIVFIILLIPFLCIMLEIGKPA